MTRHELLNRDELAARFAVEVRTITNWVKEGMPQRSRSGKPAYSWQDCYTWREKAIREDARATRHAAGDEDRAKEMAELKLRQLRTETEQAELELAERRRELVTIDFMAEEFERITNALRARLMSIPSSWEPRLAAARTPVDRQIILRDLVNEMMPLLEQAVDEVEPAESAVA
jgi:phage terminase Nu1 subunit (DNA packaging protein)